MINYVIFFQNNDFNSDFRCVGGIKARVSWVFTRKLDKNE